MLQELEIRNFRIFRKLKITQLRRINLIAGSNNSGKTSLLEAIFLLAGAGRADMLMNPNVVRMGPSGRVLGDALWRPLFSDLDIDKSISIEGLSSPQELLKLEVVRAGQQATEIPPDYAGETSVSSVPEIRSLEVRYRGPNEEPVTSRLMVEGPEVKLEQPNTPAAFDATIIQARTANSQEDAIRLARLRKQKRVDFLLEALQIIDPKLQSIEDNSSSGTPMIWGDIGLTELVPLAVMGDGMTHLARLVLAISQSPDGVVLVDEIENGIHHSVLPEVWRAIDTASRQFNTQIFATTHSFECVRAAHDSLCGEDFRLHRLDKTDDGNRCVTYDPDTIAAALDFNLEVR